MSLWQSAVEQVAHEALASPKRQVSREDVLAHPHVEATHAAVHVHTTGEAAPLLEASADGDAKAPTLVQLFVQLLHVIQQHESRVEAIDEAGAASASSGEERNGNPSFWDRILRFLGSLLQSFQQGRLKKELEIALHDLAAKFSDHDPDFILKAIPVFLHSLTINGGKRYYHDWKKLGEPIDAYGVIDYRLPNDARVLILGDWGTGLDDAVSLLRAAVKQHEPHAIIHLGDVYYAGTPHEFKYYFNDVFDQVFEQRQRIPIFNLPGNHDYFSSGKAFYDSLEVLNKDTPAARQQASYFCLRTEDDQWQFLGMDTGVHDYNFIQEHLGLSTTWLNPSEVEWHHDKLDRFDGATVLLSHHQLFTATDNLTGHRRRCGPDPYLNRCLQRSFCAYFSDKIAAWLWGHEHIQILYDNGLFGLSKGRLIGCSAWEEYVSEDPYANTRYSDRCKYPAYPVKLQNVKLSKTPDCKFYNHGYAVMDFGARRDEGHPALHYWEYTAWGRKSLRPKKEDIIHREITAEPIVKPGG